MTPGRVILSESQFLSCSQAQNQCGNQSRSQKDGARNPGFPTKEGQTAERGVDLQPVGLLTGTAAHGRDNPTAVAPANGTHAPCRQSSSRGRTQSEPGTRPSFPKAHHSSQREPWGRGKKITAAERAHVNAAQSEKTLPQEQNPAPTSGVASGYRRRQQTGTQVLPARGAGGGVLVLRAEVARPALRCWRARARPCVCMYWCVRAIPGCLFKNTTSSVRAVLGMYWVWAAKVSDS